MRKNFFLFSLMLALLLTFSLTTSNQSYAYKIDKNHNVYGWIVGGYQHHMDSKRGNYDNGARDGFYLAGLRVGVNGYAFEKVFYDVQIKLDSAITGSTGSASIANGYDPAGIGLFVIENAWITFEQFGPYLNITFGGLPIKFNRSYNDTSGFKQALRTRAIGDTFFNHYDDLGLLLHGSAPVLGALKYWIGIWNGQGGPSTNGAAAGLGDGSLTLTARLQVDFNKSWKNGDEYFEKDWNATLGVGFYYGNSTYTNNNNATPTNIIGAWGNTTNTTLNSNHGGARNILGLTVDLGFHYDTWVYVEGSLTTFSGKGKDGVTVSSATGWQATIGSIPIPMLGIFVRLSQAPIDKSAGQGSQAAKYTINGNLGSLTVLDIAANIFFAKHSLKIQPAVQFDLKRKNMTGSGSSTVYYGDKEATFWLNAQYNF